MVALSRWRIAWRSLWFNRKVNLAVALGVAAATAVLSGALIVGESMRGSLRDLTLDRLGSIDYVLMSPGFFRESLDLYQRDKENQSDIIKVPMIYFNDGTVKTRDDSYRAANVSIMGIRKNFWSLYPKSESFRTPARDEIILNETLALDLGIEVEDFRENSTEVTIRIPKQKLLPADSALGEKDDLYESLVGLKVIQILPDAGPGRFGLHPSQLPPRNAFVSIEALQRVLGGDALRHKSTRQQANLMLIDVRKSGLAAARETILAEASPTLEDMGLNLKHVRQIDPQQTGRNVFDYYSFSSDRLVIDTEVATSVSQLFPAAQSVLVYLANQIEAVDQENQSIPFSIAAGIDFGPKFQPVSSVTGEPARPLTDQQIALSEWAASDLGVEVGDSVRLKYFEPEATHGDSVEVSRDFVVADILKLTRPSQPFDVNRRGDVKPAEFEQTPTLINDPDFTPEVPGLTDARSIESWDLPFETTGIEAEDEDYWNYFRTTPKAFVSLAAARKMWRSRFGDTTSLRIDAAELTDDEAAATATFLQQFRADGHLGGLQLIPIREQGLRASSGSTPFDVLFLSLSMFVIASALILVSLLFKLGIEQRSSELGLLGATGYSRSTVVRLWLMESTGVCLVGAIAGAVLGVGYAALVLWGLRTFWVGAVTTPFLQLHVAWWNLPLGVLLGMLVCVATIYWTIRRASNLPARQLLAGQTESTRLHVRQQNYLRWVAIVSVMSAFACLVAARQLAGETQAMAFVAGGFCLLLTLLILTWIFLSLRKDSQLPAVQSVLQLATSNIRRNALRSTLTIGLVAVAAFLILAISAFQLSPSAEGTANFDYLAETSQPVFADLSTAAGQREVLRDGEPLATGSVVLPLRRRPGDDASCNNVYQTARPTVLGVSDAMVEYFDDAATPLAWMMTSARSAAERDNPWRLLQQPVAQGEPIPVVIDKNTAWYSLKIYVLGQQFDIKFDEGRTVKFQLVGLLDNTVLQGSLLVGEANFKQAFPNLSGYRFFLVKTLPDGVTSPTQDRSGAPSDLDRLSDSLADQGFEARSATAVLDNYLAVQNTYLNTFQSLGALGLLLGTFGLVAVQIRSVFERRKELAVMRALGYSFARLSMMVLLENALLLLTGLLMGTIAALFATVPFMLFDQASLPWREILLLGALIAPIGLLASWLAARHIRNMPLLQSLRV